MDDSDIPDIGSLESGEICTGLLIILSLIATFAITDYSTFSTSFPITLGLVAIAMAILTVGRRISSKSED
jgi:hypothetical protein